MAPAAPLSHTATYISDSRTNLAWTRPGGTATPGPNFWTSIEVQRTDNGLSYVRIGLLGGPTQNWADLTTRANTRYGWRIRSVNPDGVSAWVYSTPSWINTTPAAPSAVTATKNSAGNIVVSWQNNSPVPVTFEVQDETTTIGTPASSPYTHSSPNPMVTHRYRVRAIASGPRNSQWSTYSNTVALLAPPAAPTNLTPDGNMFPIEDALVMSWAHSPTDTTPQTAYELRHRLSGGSWTTVSGTTAQQRTITGYSTPGSVVQWEVRTKGAHADWSPWSYTAAVVLQPRPTATISAPGSTVTAPSVAVTWGYYQAGGLAQVGWEAEILQGSVVVAQGSDATNAGTWTTPNVLADGGSYTLRVRVRAAGDLWSLWDTQAFTVSYPTPPVSDITAVWQDGEGYVLVEVESNAGSPATVSHTIERSDDGQATWTVLAEGLGLVTSINDWEAPAAGTYHYRATAVSALPSLSYAVAEVTVPDVDVNCAIWISGGPGFSVARALAWNPTRAYENGRTRVLNDYAGRTESVETSATQAPRSITAQAEILPGRHNEDAATLEELEEVFDLIGPHLYRDPAGRVMYGSLSPLQAVTDTQGVTSVSFSITRSARPTDAQADSLAGYFEEIE